MKRVEKIVMEMFSLYVDFDNTIVNSRKKGTELLNEKYNENKDHLLLRKYNFKDLFPYSTSDDINYVFDNPNFFKNLCYEDGCKEVLDFASNLLDIKIVTTGTDINLDLKKKWIKENLPYVSKFYGVKTPDKSSVNMTGSIHIDDNIESLRSSNASVKILLTNGISTDWNQYKLS